MQKLARASFFVVFLQFFCYNICVIEKFQGIILKVADYKDADKLATIFSLEEGILAAKFTGVRKDKAKLKAAAQPFVFADFVVAPNGKNLTITQANVLEDFPNILRSYSKTICAFMVVDIINKILPAQKKEELLFLQTLNALKNIETENEYQSLIAFVLNFFALSGVELVFVQSNYAYLDTYSGNFVSEKAENSLQIDKEVYSTLKNINLQIANPTNNLQQNANNLNEKALKQAIRLLKKIVYLKFGVEIKSFDFV